MNISRDKIMTIFILMTMVFLVLLFTINIVILSLFITNELKPEPPSPTVIIIERGFKDVDETPKSSVGDSPKDPPKPKEEPVTPTQPTTPAVPEKKPVAQPPVTPKPVEEKPVSVKSVDDETYLLAQIISAESKGEPYEGMIAVGNVVMNRVESPKFPNTIKGVIFQKGQFSPVSDGSIHNKPTDVAIKAAKEVLNGKEVVGDDILFFYNPKTSTNSWIFSRKVVEVIGRHAFAL